MLVTTSNSVSTGNPFLPSGPSAKTTSDKGSFDQQLSQALAESLGKLGVGPGEVNITIKNGSGTGADAALRQIIVSYRLDSLPVATGSTAAPVTATPAAATPAPAASSTAQDWAPYTGPRDGRDETPAGGGTLTPSGSPLIKLNETGVKNQYGYAGAATRNPYFTSPSNPLRPGLVLGFQNWFQDNFVLGTPGGPTPANKIFNSTSDGAEEALRLVQEYAPEAKITQKVWGSEGGPYMASKPTYSIELPDGRMLNAGALLHSYYNQGYGVSISSDDMLRRAMNT